MQKLDSWAKGLVFAFGTYTTDGEQKDQDDVFQNISLGSNQRPGCEIYENGVGTKRYGPNRRGVLLERFHRTANQRASTFNAAAALGWRVFDTVSVGAGLAYVSIEELAQEYQDVRTSAEACTRRDESGIGEVYACRNGPYADVSDSGCFL
jgi:hypothetical protein